MRKQLKELSFTIASLLLISYLAGKLLVFNNLSNTNISAALEFLFTTKHDLTLINFNSKSDFLAQMLLFTKYALYTILLISFISILKNIYLHMRRKLNISTEEKN